MRSEVNFTEIFDVNLDNIFNNYLKYFIYDGHLWESSTTNITQFFVLTGSYTFPVYTTYQKTHFEYFIHE